MSIKNMYNCVLIHTSMNTHLFNCGVPGVCPSPSQEDMGFNMNMVDIGDGISGSETQLQQVSTQSGPSFKRVGVGGWVGVQKSPHKIITKL